MNNVMLSLVIGAVLVSAPAMAKKEPELSGLELQQIQSKDFETTKDIAFAAVMTVLQDSGYRIGSADMNAGLITGTASTKGQMTYNILYGFGAKKKTPIVSVFVEGRGPRVARVRFNFVLTEGKSRKSFSDETPILEPAVYKDAFEKVSKEIFVRQSMETATTPTPAVTAVAATPSN